MASDAIGSTELKVRDTTIYAAPSRSKTSGFLMVNNPVVLIHIDAGSSLSLRLDPQPVRVQQRLGVTIGLRRSLEYQIASRLKGD